MSLVFVNVQFQLGITRASVWKLQDG